MAYNGGNTIDTSGGLPVQIDPLFSLSVAKLPSSTATGLLSAYLTSLVPGTVEGPKDLQIFGSVSIGGVPITVGSYFLILQGTQLSLGTGFLGKTVSVDSSSVTFFIYTFSQTLGANIFQINLFSSYDVLTGTFNGFEAIAQPPSNPAYDIIIGPPIVAGSLYLTQFSFTAPGTVDLNLSTRLRANQYGYLGF
jgi:hypothetical protein